MAAVKDAEVIRANIMCLEQNLLWKLVLLYRLEKKERKHQKPAE